MLSSGKGRKYFFLAVNTGLVNGGLPDARCRTFYRERSRHGLHCAIVGNVITPSGMGTNDVCAKISGAPAWRELAHSIADQGALPGIQLSSAWRKYQGMRSFVSRPEENRGNEYREIAAAISLKDAISALDALHRGTELAVKAGFRHVQLHAAHGYLYNLLVDSRLSSHTDIAIKAIDRWANDLASINVESSIRFSMRSGDATLDQEHRDQLVDELAKMPVNYLDVSAGFYNINKRLIYPSTPEILAERVSGTLELAGRLPHAQFILSGMSAHAWDISLPSNVHIGICRDLIANPNFLVDRAGGCKTCMKCHYFSRGDTYLTCGTWDSNGVKGIRSVEAQR